MESTTFLDKMLYHLKQQGKTLVKTYTSANLSRVMQREGMKCCRILQYPRESNKIVMFLKDGYGILNKNERTPQHSVKF